MTSSRVQWSPNNDNIYAYCNATTNKLYVCTLDDNDEHQPPQHSVVELPLYDGVQWFDWRHTNNDSDDRYTLSAACGDRLIIGSPSTQQQQQQQQYIEARQSDARITVVAWNRDATATHQLAVGMERTQTSATTCLYMVDVNRMATPTTTVDHNDHRIACGLQGINVNCIVWAPNTHDSVCVGSDKALHFVDFRRSLSTDFVACGSRIRQLVADPHDDHTIMSLSADGIVRFWDLRMLTDEANTRYFRANANTACLAWRDRCTQSQHQLTSVAVNQSFVTLWDANDDDAVSTKSGGVFTPTYTTRSTHASEGIAWLDWHPTRAHQYVTISTDGQCAVHTYRDDWLPTEEFFGRSDINDVMRARGELGYGLESRMNERICKRLRHDQQLYHVWQWITRCDIMKSGVSPGLTRLLGVAVGDTSTGTHVSEKIYHQSDSDMLSSLPILVSDERSMVLKACGWCELSSSTSGGRRKLLRDRVAKLESNDEYERAAALALFHMDITLCISVLQRGAVATRTDTDANNDDLSLFSMLLAAYASVDASPKKQFVDAAVANLHQHIHNPYLQACATLLTRSRDDSIRIIAAQNNMQWLDRVAFAMRFMLDTELRGFLREMYETQVATGDIRSVLLTSFRGAPFMHVMQSYLDRCADIQTVAIFSALAVATSADDTAPEHMAQLHAWIDTYRNLLDEWRYWHQRAKFDIARSQLQRLLSGSGGGGSNTATGAAPAAAAATTAATATDSSTMTNAATGIVKVPAQISAVCTYCKMSIKLYNDRQPHQMQRGRNRFSRGSVGPSRSRKQNNPSRSPTCAHCSKILPKCAVCLMGLTAATELSVRVAAHSTRRRRHLPGTRAADAAAAAAAAADDDEKKNADGPSAYPVDNWFSWCQQCRHGGHLSHMREWFESNNTQCPVTACECKCNHL